jgi:uncharacterized protein YggE
VSLLRLAAVIAKSKPSGFYADTKERRRIMIEGALLTIVAEGHVSEKPDLATLTAGVVTQAPSAEAALADNAQQMTAVLSALRAIGITGRDVQTSGLSVSPEYAYEEGQSRRLTGYSAVARVQVCIRDLSRLGKVIDGVVANGSNQLHGVRFGLAEPDPALDRARVNAINNARARAELYAGAAQLRVHRIVSISETDAATSPRDLIAVRSVSSLSRIETPTEPGELDMSVEVTMVFELK